MTSRTHAYLLALALALYSERSTAASGEDSAERVETLELQSANLSVLLRDNSNSPKVLSGLDSLFNRQDARDFDAFDPDDRGASAGLNFEHVICGHSNQFNAFTPRKGRYDLVPLGDGASAKLVR